VTTVVNVPPSLDDHSFDDVLRQLTGVPGDAKVLLDARHVRWASPFGLTALLTFAQTRAEMPALAVPELEEPVPPVVLGPFADLGLATARFASTRSVVSSPTVMTCDTSWLPRTHIGILLINQYLVSPPTAVFSCSIRSISPVSNTRANSRSSTSRF